MKKILGFILKFIKWLAIGIVSVLILCVASHYALTAYEKNSNPPIGKMIDVDGGKMHVYTRGNSPNTIVLMPGLATPSPIYDYMPLVKALENDYTVCVVEPLGYGWSSQTNTPRTNEAIVEQTRSALKQANLKPPYILVPHSVSGLYALHYANTYPEEIKAVVGLDITYPASIEFMPKPDSQPINLFGLANAAGILRIAVWLDPTLLEYEYPEYTARDKQVLAMFNAWNYGNKTVENETSEIFANCTKLLNKKFPETIPVRMILSSENIESGKNESPAFDWVLEHEKLIEGNKNAQTITVDGSHYIYYGNTAKVVGIINEVGK